MLTPEQIQRVKATWEKASTDPEAAATLFYGRLFEVAPGVRPLFKGDMTEQGAKLMKTVDLAVRSLDDLAKIVPALQQLGRRHVDIGAKPEHYPVVGETLIWTLATALGDEFGEEERLAWGATYDQLAQVMLDV